jgi:hypothetical protein
MRVKILKCTPTDEPGERWYADFIGSEFVIDDSYHILAEPPKQTLAGELITIYNGHPRAILRDDVEVLPENVVDVIRIVKLHCPYCQQYLFDWEGKQIPQPGVQVNLNDLKDGDYPAPKFGDKLGCPACKKGTENPYEGLAWLSAVYFCNFGTVREVKNKKRRRELRRRKEDG